MRTAPTPIARLALALGALTLVAALGACGAAPTDPSAAASSGTTPGSSVGSDHGADPPGATATFPVTIDTAGGASVTIPARPERIVSLSPSLTEMVYAVGAGPQTVAVDKSSDHPAGTPMTDLSGFKPNVEAVAGYEPDLVLLARDKDGVAGALAGLGIPVLVLALPPDLDGVYDEIDAVGRATGHPSEAGEVVAGMQRDIDEVVASSPSGEPVSAFYELSDGLDTVTSTGLVGSILTELGYRNVADGAPPGSGSAPALSNEALLAADPKVIFVAHADGAEVDAAAVAARPGWAELQAVRDGHVVVLDADVASRWGPRVVELVRALAEAADDLRS